MSANDGNRRDSRRLRVAVFGEWGETNLGDWAIYYGVEEFFSAADTVIDPYRCGALRPFEVSASVPGANHTPASEGRSATIRSSTAAPMQLLKRSVRGLRQEWLVRRLMPRLAQADLVCVGGGALLCDRNLHFPQSLVAIARAVQALRKPLWCLGCSVDGDWTPRGQQMIMEFLESCDAIAVRDVATAERLRHATGRQVPLFGDFALPSQPASGVADRPERKFALGINVSQIPAPWHEYQERYEDALVALGRRFLIESQQPPRIVLFTTGTPQDDGPMQRVRRRLAAADATVVKPANLSELEATLDDSEIVIATRLHAAIVALARGRPVVGFSPSPKIGSFFASIGLEPFFLQIPQASEDELIAMLGERAELDRQWQRMDQSQCRETRQDLLDRLQQLGNRSLAS